ncbi:glycoside hydrolase family 47 protein [Atractiella rhizophila]|nr:glycoside hydrolase family 47 protein [Atractiella rhizophila]
MSDERKRQLRELTRETFNHAWKSYLRVAFPADEIRPVSCKPLGPDHSDPKNIDLNDVLGDFSLTLVDTLDTFIVLGDKSSFESAVRLAIQYVRFDKDVKIQVFESTIRVLGGLLSAHIFASEPEHGFAISWYRGELLTLAHDLGRRLLPAFQWSRTGIPYARINLKHGLQPVESIETCSAGAGSLILEFATLSRLTGDGVFEQVARKAFWAIWNRRSDLGLVGNTINLQNGNWIYGVSSVGAGIDSFLEYMIKAYVLLGEDEYYRAWKESYGAIMKYVRDPGGFWFRSVNMQNGQIQSVDVDSLSAFWPGALVLAGDVPNAIKNHLVYSNLWNRYGGIPETFNVQTKEATNPTYPLRPEFVESNYFLYRATKDPYYLDMAERIVGDLVNRTRVECGLAGISDLTTGKLDDRMHSFALSETLKYLFLTFDEDNWVNKDDSNTVFTTEGHLLPLNKKYLRKPVRSTLLTPEIANCPVPDPLHMHNARTMLPSVSTRLDAEYARFIADYTLDPIHAHSTGLWHAAGTCELPRKEVGPTSTMTAEELIDSLYVLPSHSPQDFTVELIFTNPLQSEDLSPNHSKVMEIKGGLHVKDIQGLKLQLTRLMDGSGYHISKIGPYNVPSGSRVLISDPLVIQAVDESSAAVQTTDNPKALLRFTVNLPNVDSPISFLADGVKATFGPDVHSPVSRSSLGVSNPRLPVVDLLSLEHAGCKKYKGKAAGLAAGKIPLIRRGGCSFSRKMKHAAKAGAEGLLVWNEEDGEFLPSEDPAEKVEKTIPLVMLKKVVGGDLERLFNMKGEIEVEVEEELLEDFGVRNEGGTQAVYLSGYGIHNVDLLR